MLIQNTLLALSTTQNVILIAIAVVLLVAIIARRKSRKNKGAA